MTMTERDDHELEGFFRAARAAAPRPSDALMARILADAGAEMRQASVQPAPGSPEVRGSGPSDWLARLWGGWRALGGLATATVAGLWIGYAGIADPNTLTGGLIGAETSTALTVDLMPETDVTALAAGWEG